MPASPDLPPPRPEPGDPGRYGRSFAEVYDQWYPGGDEAAVVAHLRDRLAPGASVLELGVGTGRLALPLARAGFIVTGIDASTEMLAQLGAKDPDGHVGQVRADAGDPAGWPDGQWDAVLAACNLLLNLPSAEAQQRCVAAAAARLAPGGLLVVELSGLSAPEAGPRHLEVRSVEADRVVLIATDSDPVTGVVQGNHIELRHGEPVVLRPWSIRMLDLPELDSWCRAVGLELADRHADWSGTPAPGEAPVTVSVYRPA